jgi:hypothetical protein
LLALTFVVAGYRLAREQYEGTHRDPTPAELRAAADELTRRTHALAGLLATPELGGLVDFLPDIDDADPRAFVLKLRAHLNTLGTAVGLAATVLPSMHRHNDPRRDFARDVARAMLAHTGERPTAYFSTEYGARGAYAELLGLLFVAVDGDEPGDLRKLVQLGARATR